MVLNSICKDLVSLKLQLYADRVRCRNQPWSELPNIAHLQRSALNVWSFVPFVFCTFIMTRCIQICTLRPWVYTHRIKIIEYKGLKMCLKYNFFCAYRLLKDWFWGKQGNSLTFFCTIYLILSLIFIWYRYHYVKEAHYRQI